MKLNLKIRSCEKEALLTLAATHDRTLGGIIRAIAFGPNPAHLCSELQTLLKGKETRSGTRIPVTLKLSKTEAGILKANTPSGHTFAEALRIRVGLRPISFWFVSAARASSRRGNRPVISSDAIKDYFSLLEERALLAKALEGVQP